MSTDHQSADLVVIGGGLVGAATALAAVRAGARTLLIDRHDTGRATDAGAGILSPQTWSDPDDQWHRFGMEAAAHMGELVDELTALGTPDTGYRRCGLLSIARQEAEVPWFEEMRRHAQRRAPHGLGELSPQQAASLFPPLGECVRVLSNPDAARVDGRALLASLLHAAGSLGLRRLSAELVHLESRGDVVHNVFTTSGSVACGGVVVAAGAWSSAVTEQLGVALPVSPMRGQIAHLRLAGADSDDWPIVQPIASFYLVSWPGGRVACGGTLEPQAGYDSRATASGVHQLVREALRIAPGLGEAEFLEVRSGLRPMSPDGRPLLGRLAQWSNAYVATGHGTDGLLLGPYSGHLVATLALSGQQGPWTERFSPARFTRPG